ncbi:hypothetical protein CCR85_13475 [Rhodothalassium salexigens]|uniref:hypothetical protein n=1 Tax=Rhodothalassium salexigens TaxID=1086 RepID=UPI0019115AC2|nr:hypothetical protein [Rhodothalassium salexigens]MBK5912498.1 hypothetical protein [Rhodothalassium salexigens]
MRFVTWTLLLILFSWGAAAQEEDRRGRWSFSVFGNYDVSIGGDVHDGTLAPVADLGGLNPDLAGVGADLDIEARGYDDIYDTVFNIGGEIGYYLTGSAELLTRVTYIDSDGGAAQVGGAVVPALDTTLPVAGEFDDYNALTVEIGARYTFYPRSRLKPFFGGTVGVAFVDDIRATFRIPDADILIDDVPFYDNTTAFTASAQTGLALALTPSIDLIGEVGVRYLGDLDGDDSAIGGLGLASINDGGRRWSIPLGARLQFRF